ncbi:MAG: glycosyltransferase family 4 protein [Clostridia bacterium]|nr:glycosyltransferase family 4 protein [Clostridia bacterium]
MRILHVTFGIAPFDTGGLPSYVKDLTMQEMHKDNEVIILKPGPYKLYKAAKIILKGENTYQLINPLPVPSIFGIGNPNDYMKTCNKDIYKNFLIEIKPDVIHVHSIMGIHKEFFEVAKQLNIEMIYTTHDYFGLCFRTNFIDRDNKGCNQCDIEKCSRCNYKAGLSKSKTYVMQSNVYKRIKNLVIIKRIRKRLRKSTLEVGNISMDSIKTEKSSINLYLELHKYYMDIYSLIDYFHFNSYIAKEVFKENLGELKGKVIPLTLNTIQDCRNNENKLNKNKDITIGYIGRKEHYKGVQLLVNSLKILEKKDIKFKCNLYGDDFSDDYGLSNKIVNKGNYARKDLKKIMNDIDILVVPSIWKETFGFITLEALSCNVPVIVTNCVGSKMLLESCKVNPIVEPNEIKLAQKIEEFIEDKVKLQKYKEWIQRMDNVFDMEEHTDQILKMYKERIR